MANAWDSATPTNANTVKDTVPNELQALKTVNLQRPRLICNAGLAASVPYTFTGAGPYTSFGAIPYTTGLVPIGSYNQSLGEYTVSQAGYYKVEAMLERLGADNGVMAALESIIVQRWNGAAWSDVSQAQTQGRGVVSGTGGSMLVMGIVNCAVNDKLRVMHGMSAGSNLGSSSMSQTTSGEMNTLFIEFLRTP